MAKEVIAKLFEKKIDRVMDLIPDTIGKIAVEFRDRGAVDSSGYVIAVYNLLVSGLQELTLKRVEIEKDMWRHQAKKPTVADGPTCKNDVAAAVEQIAPRLFEFLEKRCRGLGFQNVFDQLAGEFAEAKAKCIKEADREIDIWIGYATIEPERPPIPAVPIILNFQGYGIFQTGTHAQAIVTPPIAKENARIVEDLSKARAEIAELKDLHTEQKEELIGALNAALAEASKERPNRLTVGGIITSVASATSVLANATQAYETVKGIARQFGVTLP